MKNFFKNFYSSDKMKLVVTTKPCLELNFEDIEAKIRSTFSLIENKDLGMPDFKIKE